MRHIVIITTSYPLTGDGSEAAGSFVEDFVKSISLQVKVTVVAPGLHEDVKTVNGKLVVQRYQVPQLPLSLLKASNPRHWFGIFKILRNGKKTVRHVVEQEKVDHILALWVLPSGYWARFIAKEFKIPYSTWALGSDIWSLGKIPIVKNVLKIVLQDSYINFADGLQLQEDVASLSGRPCEFLPSTRKIELKNEKVLSTKPPYKLAFLGRWHHNKGVDILCESLTNLKECDWQRIEEVRICGGGTQENIVKHAVSELTLRHHPVSVRGYLSKNEAVELLLWADYVLVPSRIESIPVIFSDAMKCGCPVVCMPIGDLPQLLTENSVGVLARDVTGGGFATAISCILKKSPHDYVLGLNKCSSDFNLERIVKRLLVQLFDYGKRYVG